MMVSEEIEKALIEAEDRMTKAMDKYADILEAVNDPDKEVRVNMMVSRIVSHFDEMTKEIISCGEALKYWNNPS